MSDEIGDNTVELLNERFRSIRSPSTKYMYMRLYAYEGKIPRPHQLKYFPCNNKYFVQNSKFDQQGLKDCKETFLGRKELGGCAGMKRTRNCLMNLIVHTNIFHLKIMSVSENEKVTLS